MRSRGQNWMGMAAALALLLGTACFLGQLRVNVPTYQSPAQSLWLEQNWSAERRDWYHHVSQGTVTFQVPYEWLVALDQPVLWPGQDERLVAPAYLDRFGFIPDAAGAHNEGGLPVGFARGGPMIDPTTSRPFLNPKTGEPMSIVGFTCAACHTGRLTYQNTALFIDGGPALTNLGEFRKAVGLALAFTAKVPGRFGRFADRVLGADATKEQRAALRAQLDEVFAAGKVELELETKAAGRSVVEGFGRLDALNRIGNQVFSLDLNKPENFAPYSAPVNYPHIWGAPWYDWVQYNGSIEQPMVRNAGEALGVRALINLSDPSRLFASSVDVQALFEIEQQLAGGPPDPAKGGWTGLRPPAWPEQVLPPIDRALADQGRALYKQHCQGCHLPPPGDAAFFEDRHWSKPNAAGQRYLRVKMIEVSDVGTDPAQAQDMEQRRVEIPAEVGIASGPYGPALGELVEKTVNHWYDAQSPATPAAERQRMNGYRENGIRAPLQYRARPLDGIWATPPYLHNGSVPTLYALLSPVEERPARFYLGNREYDPEHVGYRTDKLSGGFLVDTTLRGNWNGGHEFTDRPGRPGVIGPALSPEQRRALIEYLKTL